MAQLTTLVSPYFEIRWHGRGGQGAVTGAKSLAECVQGTGRNVVAFPEYGPERRGAPVRAFNRFSDKYIRIHTPVTTPDVVIVIDATLLALPAIKDGAMEHTVFLVNIEKTPDQVREILGLENRVVTVAANSISHKLFKREIPNSTMLGAFAKVAPHIIGIEQLRHEAKHVFSELLGADLVDKNLQAIQQGHDLCHIG
ncbi:MAG: 2-oxoacid:acceptor oxidoreductase family protein [Nibricoccus sp.]